MKCWPRASTGDASSVPAKANDLRPLRDRRAGATLAPPRFCLRDVDTCFGFHLYLVFRALKTGLSAIRN